MSRKTMTRCLASATLGFALVAGGTASAMAAPVTTLPSGTVAVQTGGGGHDDGRGYGGDHRERDRDRDHRYVKYVKLVKCYKPSYDRHDDEWTVKVVYKVVFKKHGKHYVKYFADFKDFDSKHDAWKFYRYCQDKLDDDHGRDWKHGDD